MGARPTASFMYDVIKYVEERVAIVGERPNRPKSMEHGGVVGSIGSRNIRS